MFADAARTGAYLAAIERGVRAGSVVVEIGTGVGYFAVAACRAGARRVYAIELNPAIELGGPVAADNACADRITFIREDSRRVILPEQGDLLLSDLRGVLPAYGEHIPTLVDARKRLIRPGASLVPSRDSMFAAPCVAPADWRRDHILPRNDPHGISRRAVAVRVRSNWHRCHLAADDVLADGVEWASLAYSDIESPDLSGRADWLVPRECAADGVAVWFDGDFGFGVLLSNAPSAPRTLYGQAFFPFERSLALRAGDHLSVDFRANLVDGGYLWGWDTTLTPAAGGAPTVFRQSNLAARVVALDRLRRRSAGHRPADSGSVTLMRTLTSLVDGSRTLAEIADAMHEAHPGAFRDTEAALIFASARLGSLEDEDDRTSPAIPSTD